MHDDGAAVGVEGPGRPGGEREVLDGRVEVTLAGHVDDEVGQVTGMFAVGQAERVVVGAGHIEIRAAHADPVDVNAVEPRCQPGDLHVDVDAALGVLAEAGKP